MIRQLFDGRNLSATRKLSCQNFCKECHTSNAYRLYLKSTAINLIHVMMKLISVRMGWMELIRVPVLGRYFTRTFKTKRRRSKLIVL